MSFDYPVPWSVSQNLAAKIEPLGLGAQLAQLRDDGYCLVDDAYDAAFCQRLREAVISEAARQNGHYFDIKEGEGLSAYHLLGRDDAFAEALLNPKLIAIAEYLCGGDFQLSQLSGSVRFEGATAMALHIDAQWVPPTDYNPMFTACLALDDLTLESGPTRVIPGTHRLMRNPEAKDVDECGSGVPMIGKVGSFSVWPGFTWHANFPRTQPGKRVMLHMTFCRVAYRPVEDYSHLDADFLSRWPAQLATMLGRDSWFGIAGRDEGRCVMQNYMRTWEAARQ